MPKRRNRAIYPVFANTVVSLILVAWAAAYFRRFIPPIEESEIGSAREEFLQNAARQPIPWRELDEEVFLEAKRLNKPIMLVVGSRGSRTARLADRYAFNVPELAAIVRGRFIPVRVDSIVQPEVAYCLLPLSRGAAAIDSGFQIFFLNPNGQYVYHRTIDRQNDKIDADTLKAALDRAQVNLQKWSQKDLLDTPPWELNLDEQRLMLQPQGLSMAKVETHLQFLKDQSDPLFGSWPTPAMTKLQPQSWEFLVQIHENDFAKQNLNLVLSSPIVDWVDGGFFFASRQRGWGNIEFDKRVDVNAEMAVVLAKMWRLTGIETYRQLALNTLNCLKSRFLNEFDEVVPYIQGDEQVLNRSAHASLTPRLLRERFSIEEQLSGAKLLNLNVATNPQMVPFVSSPEIYVLNRDAIESLLQKVRTVKERAERVKGSEPLGYLKSHMVARWLEAARILNDQEQLALAKEQYYNLDRYRLKDSEGKITGVVRSNRYENWPPVGLRDYVNMSDAALQFYLSFGESIAQEDGEVLLRLAMKDFASETSGVLLNSLKSEARSLPVNGVVPQIIDGNQIAPTVLALQLSWKYGTMLEKGDLIQFSQSGVAQLSNAAEEVQRGCSSYYITASLVQNNQCVIAQGENCVSMIRRLNALRPTVFAYPSRTGPDGYYWVQDGVKTGPFTLEEVASHANLSHN